MHINIPKSQAQVIQDVCHRLMVRGAVHMEMWRENVGKREKQKEVKTVWDVVLNQLSFVLR